MPQPYLSRRTVLRGLGTAIALPWLEAMASPAPLIANVTTRSAAADPVRLAFLYVPNGMHMPDWKPETKNLNLMSLRKTKFASSSLIYSGSFLVLRAFGRQFVVWPEEYFPVSNGANYDDNRHIQICTSRLI